MIVQIVPLSAAPNGLSETGSKLRAKTSVPPFFGFPAARAAPATAPAAGSARPSAAARRRNSRRPRRPSASIVVSWSIVSINGSFRLSVHRSSVPAEQIAAVDHELRPVHVRGEVGGEEDDGAGDLVRLRPAPERHAARGARPLGLDVDPFGGAGGDVLAGPL